MYERLLDILREKPALYAPSTSAFWDDPHISKAMLSAHLAPDVEAASRTHDFIDRSAAWIARTYCAPGARLLDLGCGPGLYCERFCAAGLRVTGLDLSPRSIAHATESAKQKGLDVRYLCGDYLAADFGGPYDQITLIYCDFGVLSPADRATLLRKAFAALKPGGRMLLDGHTALSRAGQGEGRTAEYCDGGFWSPQPYLCVQSNYDYPNTRNYVEQYMVVTRDRCECYNIWNQLYDPESLTGELHEAGFTDFEVFGDVTGADWSDRCDTVCAVGRKPE